MSGEPYYVTCRQKLKHEMRVFEIYSDFMLRIPEVKSIFYQFFWRGFKIKKKLFMIFINSEKGTTP